MESLKRYLRYIFSSALVLCSIMACTDEHSPEPDQEWSGDADKPFVSLKIRPVSMGSENNNGVKEKIKSLRIIMLNETDHECYIEFNKLIDLTNEEINGVNAAGFIYNILRPTIAGKKKFYLIANEEFVTGVYLNLKSEENPPLGFTEGMSLSDFLANYPADYVPGLEEVLEGSYDGPHEKVDSPKGEEFENLMNAIYFEPSYQISGNEIFLPYTAYYGSYSVGLDDDGDGKANNTHLNKTMHLVPVATKFDFEIYNYRSKNAQIDKLCISNINSKSYLNAQVGESDQMKSLDGREEWWIDWLAACSDGSQGPVDMGVFNDLWGWISDYSIPEKNNNPLLQTLQPPSTNLPWVVNAIEVKDNPYCLNLGPFYFPESINLVEKEVFDPETGMMIKKPVQEYSLSVCIHDEMVEEIYESGLMEIDTLKSLFRATHVIITINLYKTEVDIYVEMAPWVPKQFQGFVEPKDDDD